MRLRQAKYESYDALRKNMIAETELALLYGLRFPERMRRIPRIEVGGGSFQPAMATHFWAEVLGIDKEEIVTPGQGQPARRG